MRCRLGPKLIERLQTREVGHERVQKYVESIPLKLADGRAPDREEMRKDGTSKGTQEESQGKRARGCGRIFRVCSLMAKNGLRTRCKKKKNG